MSGTAPRAAAGGVPWSAVICATLDMMVGWVAWFGLMVALLGVQTTAGIAQIAICGGQHGVLSCTLSMSGGHHWMSWALGASDVP